MTLKKIIRQIKYYAQYFPFTLNTLLCGLVAYIAFRLLYQPEIKEDVSAYRPFIILMGKMIFWFILALIALSLTSSILAWIYYKWLYKSKKYKLDIHFTTDTKNGKKNRLYLNALLPGVRRPILGTIKGRLIYDDHEMTEKFSLLSNKQKENSMWRAAISGKSRVVLPDIKEYQLKGGFIYFEDMLHIFSLAIAQPISGQFYKPPVLMHEDDKDVFPKKTETLDVRIDQMRRVEGEHLNYKDFEAGDDVRRIVWKVYAKNRDLVVRIPERFEPYASHLYFYASFHASVKGQWLNESYLKEMLNYYKNNIWTVYDTLGRKEWEMRFIPDQSFTVPEQLSQSERTARIISNSVWQQDTPPSQYFNARQGAVLCISSLTDPEELKIILDQCDASTVVYFVKLSRVFRHFIAWGWIKRLIFLPPKDRLNKLRTGWTFSPMRIQIQKRERELAVILQNSNVKTATL